MSARPARPDWELPMDLIDAAGLLGAFAGVLSIAVPYFMGLTAALALCLLAAALIRRPPRGAPPTGPDAGRGFLLGFALALGAWTFLVLHPAPWDRYTGAVLGLAGLPLWAITRRRRPFGGD